MDSRDNHGRNPNSTSFLVTSLSEEETKEELLPSESTKRQKISNKEFFEALRYNIMMESIIVHNNILQYLKIQNEANQAKEASKEKEITNLQIWEILQSKLQTTPTVLSPEQLKQIEVIQDKLDNLKIYLKERIEKLEDKINTQKDEIILLNAAVVDSRKNLAASWQKHFDRYRADPDFKSYHINIPLSQRTQESLAEKQYKEYKDFIVIDNETYLNLAEDIGNDLQTKSVEEVRRSSKEKIGEIVKETLDNQWSSLPTEKRKQVIQEELERGDLQEAIHKKIWVDIGRSNEFREDLADYQENNKNLKKAEKVFDADKAERKELLNKLKIVEEHSTKLEEFKTNPPKVSAEARDNHLKELNKLTDDMTTEVKAMGQTKPEATAEELASENDDLLAELNAMMEEADEVEKNKDISRGEEMENRLETIHQSTEALEKATEELAATLPKAEVVESATEEQEKDEDLDTTIHPR